MNPPFPILFVGNAQRQEFCAAAAWLESRCARMTSDIPAALDILQETDFPPALIVLAEINSKPFTADHLDTLRRAAPLARIIRLLDPWLEGESRSGKPLPASWQAQWHQWSSRLRRPTDPDSGSASELSFSHSSWSLPVTASEDDRLLASIDDSSAIETISSQTESPIQEVSPNPLIAVFAQHRETAQSFCDICTRRGWKSLWLRSVPEETPLSVNAVIIDLAFGIPRKTETLTAIRSATGSAPLIVLLGFPRPEDVSRLQSAGVSAVVAKPFLADDLLREIEQLLPANTSA
jgi:CheY-like chemotaxis protein